MSVVPILCATGQFIHTRCLELGWDTEDSTLPRLFVLTDRPDGRTHRYEATLTPLPRPLWRLDHHSPADTIAALTPQRALWHETYQGLLFTMEAWELVGQMDSLVDRERMLDIAARREIKHQPDRISGRFTVVLGRDDEIVFLRSNQHSEGMVIVESDTDPHTAHTMSASAVPRAMRRLNDRIMSMMD